MAAPTPEGLLKAARHLLPSSPGRPSISHLRRAISTAYYGVFCALCVEVGRPHPSPLDLVVRRLVSHSAARDVFKNIARLDKKTDKRFFNWLPGGLECDSDLVLFAESFIFLLAQRERADYDHLWTPTKKDAEDAINWAEDAFEQLERAKSKASVQVRTVCIAVIADSRNRKRMRL